MKILWWGTLAILLHGSFGTGICLTAEAVNPPPMRPLPVASQRPLATGPARFVDGTRGDDQHAGTAEAPWKSLKHSFAQLEPGDTLYLRGGIYREPAYIALAGRSDAPITIRSYPGELAILDGSLPEFFERPAEAWEPFAGGAPGEYRSVRAYRNVRHVLGAFADSLIGLQVYHDPRDLRAENELWISSGDDVAPLYCGPGVWYDRETSRIHIRLAHTQLDAIGDRNYRGETDPRKLRLLIAPFASQPLVLDDAVFVSVQDLVVRGAGFDTVAIRRCQDVELDNVTIYTGTHGLRIETTVGLWLSHCAIRGQTPPWGFRSELKHSYWGEENSRDIVRLTGMILLLAEEGKLYRYPQNRDWEIDHCEFTDGHDGLYLGGVRGVRFHHNRLDNLHDDGIYLSAWGEPGGDVNIYQNHISRCLTTFACGELTPANRAQAGAGTRIYRNVIDLRGPVPYGRPTPENRAGTLQVSRLCGDHGSPMWEPLWFYHNTVLGRPAEYAFGMASHTGRTTRQVFNNLFLHAGPLPSGLPQPGDDNVALDGNWHAQLVSEMPTRTHAASSNGEKPDFLTLFRGSPAFKASRKWYADGWCVHDRIADPGLRIPDDWRSAIDVRLPDGSAAIDAGVALPADWPDPLRKIDSNLPDVGALPVKSEPLSAGLLPIEKEKPR